MIQQTLREIEEKLKGAESIPAERRGELLELFAALRSEVGDLEQSHREKAREIAGHTGESAGEATKAKPDPANLQRSLEELSSSVSGFEESHPKLVDAVNRICVTLSSLGI